MIFSMRAQVGPPAINKCYYELSCIYYFILSIYMFLDFEFCLIYYGLVLKTTVRPQSQTYITAKLQLIDSRLYHVIIPYHFRK